MLLRCLNCSDQTLNISAGSVIGFAFEACEKGIISAPNGISLAFGSVDGAEYLIRSIALQDGDLGRLLGQGVKRAASQLGQQADAFALHVKGMELPGWAPRCWRCWPAAAPATSERL